MTALVVLSLFYLVSDYFTAAGIDESVIYHLQVGLGGAGFGEYAGLMIMITALLGAWLFLYYILARRASLSSGGFYNRVSILLSAMALLINPASHDLYQLYLPSASDNSYVENYVGNPEVGPAINPLNLVYIYAESLEHTYFDEKIFPGLMPNLQQLKQQALVFDNIQQVSHTGWTIAGMVASQCGVPLYTSGGANSLSGMHSFMTAATCMGDILNHHGYQLAYMGGASAKFAGKGNFYLSHGFDSVQGRDELQEQLADINYQSSWGLYDDELFHLAHGKLAGLNAAGQPFGLFLLTLDTHHPQGHMPASCAGLHYLDKNNPMLDAVHCADKLIGGFVRSLLDSGLGENTLLVLASDHLAMKNTAYSELDKGQRRNLFMLIPPGLEQSQRIAKPATILDTGVTVLAQLGFSIEQLGFGRNLLSGDSLLSAMDGLDIKTFNGLLAASRSGLSSLWQYPDIRGGIKFSENKNELTIGAVSYSYPLLILLDQNNRIDQVIFDFNSEISNAERLQTQELGQKYFWVDRCYKQSAVTGRLLEDRYCITLGQLGGETPVMRKLEQGMELSSKKIVSWLKKKYRPTQQTYVFQQESLRSLARYGVLLQDIITVPVDFPYPEMLAISASGLYQGRSLIQAEVAGKVRSTPAMPRGISVLALDSSDVPQSVIHLDICSETAPLPTPELLAEHINYDVHDYYLVLAHDTAHCGDAEQLPLLFADSPLQYLDGLSFRQGYLALLGRGNVLYEAPAVSEQVQAIAFSRAHGK